MALITEDLHAPPRPQDPAPPRARTSALALAGALSLTAAAIHFSFAGAHFDERASHGAFFLAAGALQAVWAALALRAGAAGSGAAAAVAVVVRLSLVHVGIAAVWVASRTVGLDGMDAEPVGYPDALATAAALGAVVLALVRPALAQAAAAGLAAVAAAAGLFAMTPRFATAHGHGSEAAAAEHGHVEAGAAKAAALTGDTPCERSGQPALAGAQVGNGDGHSHRGPVPQQPIDQATRLRLAEQQAVARTVADKYKTVADATARGYRKSTPYIPCIGAHYTNAALAARFDPASPAELLFDGTNPDSNLVGLSYLVYHPGGAPEGFAGPNDVWHQHNSNGGLCFDRQGVVVAGEGASPEECGALGGRKVLLTDVWMLHDWIVPGWECSWGVFAPECPELGGRTGGTAWD